MKQGTINLSEAENSVRSNEAASAREIQLIAEATAAKPAPRAEAINTEGGKMRLALRVARAVMVREFWQVGPRPTTPMTCC